MQFTKVCPVAFETDIVYPRRQEYLAALKKVIEASKTNRYFGIYYSGMAMTATGNWAVLDDESDHQVAQITLDDIF